MREGINVILRYEPDWNGVRLWIVEVKGDERRIAKPLELEFEPHALGEMAPDPTLMFSGYAAEHFLQDLADGLSAVGYKPKVEHEWQGELKATKTHLEDMRAIAFKAGKP